jgi:outer membrane protein/protease secretion system outer membrane protein
VKLNLKGHFWLTASSRAFALSFALIAGHPLAWSLDLTQAYQAALAQDATIRAARAGADSGRERLPQARAQLLPSLSASFGRNSNRLQSSTPNFLGQVQTTQDVYASSNKTLTLRQPLYRPFNAALFRQAQAQVADVNASLEKELQNLSVRVGGAYFEALLAEDQLLLVASLKSLYATQLDAARKLLASGSGIRTDIDDAQARLDMAIAQELEAKQNVDYTRQQLQILIDRPVDSLAKLDLHRLELLLPEPANVDRWLEKAEQESPEVMSGRALVEVARQEVEKAKAGHLPTVDAIAQWSQSSSENLISIRSSYDTKAIGVQVAVPIFSGGYVNSQVRQALADQERSEQQLEALKRDLSSRVYSQYRSVTEGILKIRALEQAVRSADQLVVSSRRAFQAGSRTQLDILNAEQQRMTSMRDLSQARYIYLIARLRLQSLVGSSVQESIDQTNAWLMH